MDIASADFTKNTPSETPSKIKNHHLTATNCLLIKEIGFRKEDRKRNRQSITITTSDLISKFYNCHQAKAYICDEIYW